MPGSEKSSKSSKSVKSRASMFLERGISISDLWHSRGRSLKRASTKDRELYMPSSLFLTDLSDSNNPTRPEAAVANESDHDSEGESIMSSRNSIRPGELSRGQSGSRHRSPTDEQELRRPRSENFGRTGTPDLKKENIPPIERTMSMSAAEKRERDTQRRKRMIDNPTPLFVRKPSTGSVFSRNSVGAKVAETGKTLSAKSAKSPQDDGREPPYNIPKSWGSRATKRDKWLQKIMYPENTEEVKELEPARAQSQEPEETDFHQDESVHSLDSTPSKAERSHLPDSGEYEGRQKSAQSERYRLYLENVQRQFEGRPTRSSPASSFYSSRRQSADSPIQSIETHYPAEEHTPPSMARRSRQNTYSNSPEPRSTTAAVKTWGSRAKKTPSWMRKILSPEEPLERISPPSSEQSSEKGKTSSDLQPSADFVPAAQEPTPPSSRPASAQPALNYGGAETNKFEPWNTDVDFTSDSLMTSPMLRVKTTKLDEVREREIQSLTARAVATNRLEEIMERNSEERSIHSRSRSRTPSARSYTPSIRSQTPSVKSDNNSDNGQNLTGVPTGYEQYVGVVEEVGQPVPDTPIVVYKNGTYQGKVRSNSPSFEKEKEDSFESLRKLARAMSQSPGPDAQRRAEEKKVEEDQQSDLEKSTEQLFEIARQRGDNEGSSSKEQEADVVKESDPELQQNQEKENTNGKEAEKRPATSYESRLGITSITEETNVRSASRSRSRDPSARPVYEGTGLSSETIVERPANIKRRNTLSTTPLASPTTDSDPERRISAEAKLFDIHESSNPTSGHQSSQSSKETSEDDASKPKTIASSILPISKIPAPKFAPSGLSRKDTPKPRVDPMTLPTPKVTGAFIDTPAPTIRKRIPRLRSQSVSSPESEFMGVGEDNRPASAGGKNRSPATIRKPRGPLINTAKLTTAAEDLREIQLKAQAEIPTAEDLDALLALEAKAVAEMQEKEAPVVPQTERERLIERQCIERMQHALKSTSSAVRDASQGLERLEKRVSSLPDNEPGTSEQDDSQPMFTLKMDIAVPDIRRTLIWKLFKLWLILCFLFFIGIAIWAYIEYNSDPVLYMGASDWWLGADGPARIVGLEEGRGMLADELL